MYNLASVSDYGYPNIGIDFAFESSFTGCWITTGNLLVCGSVPTIQLYPLGSSTTFLGVGGGFATNGKYVAIRMSDNQLIGFTQISSALVAGSVTNIPTPEKAKQVTYNGAYMCIVTVSGAVYCSFGFGMIAGVELEWRRLYLSLSSIRVISNGALIGIDANNNLMVATNCLKPFWIQASGFKFNQVHTVDGNNVMGLNEANQLVYTTNFYAYLLPFPGTLSATSLVFGDGLLSWSPHPYNDHNPIVLEKQYEKTGTSYLRLLSNSFRMYSCSEPPCYDTESKLKVVFQDGVISTSKGICINAACLSEVQFMKIVEMLDYFFTAEEF
jgi:hypothetical protein